MVGEKERKKRERDFFKENAWIFKRKRKRRKKKGN